jgi:hypothetical protein
MTTHDSPHGHPAAFNGAVASYSLLRICGAAGIVSACSWKKRRYRYSIEPDEHEYQLLHHQEEVSSLSGSDTELSFRTGEVADRIPALHNTSYTPAVNT